MVPARRDLIRREGLLRRGGRVVRGSDPRRAAHPERSNPPRGQRYRSARAHADAPRHARRRAVARRSKTSDYEKIAFAPRLRASSTGCVRERRPGSRDGFLFRALALDPKMRPTAEEALRDEYFRAAPAARRRRRRWRSCGDVPFAETGTSGTGRIGRAGGGERGEGRAWRWRRVIFATRLSRSVWTASWRGRDRTGDERTKSKLSEKKWYSRRGETIFPRRVPALRVLHARASKPYNPPLPVTTWTRTD